MANELQKVDWTETLPDAQDLKRHLTGQLNRVLADARRNRVVATPEDTWPLVRSLTDAHDVLTRYGKVFREVAQVVKAEVEEELLEAVHEQNGVPISGMTVPDSAGDIVIDRDAPNVYDIDLDALRQVAATVTQGRYESQDANDPAVTVGLIMEAMSLLLELGKFEPQVSKVKAFAVRLGREGGDDLASVVTSAVSKRTPYKGIKLNRKDPA